MRKILISLKSLQTTPPLEQLTIPLIHQKTVNKRLVTNKPKTLPIYGFVFAASIITTFCLNARAANTAPIADAQTAAISDASKTHKVTYQEHLERMRTMTPEQRISERKLMLQEMRNMPPDQRTEQRKEMRKHWKQMPSAERKLIRVRMKEHWKNMPPAQHELRRKEMREHFKSMSPKERQRFKSDMDMLDGPPAQGYNGKHIKNADGTGPHTRG